MKIQVFRETLSFLADIIKEGQTSSERINQFYQETSQASFLITNREKLRRKGFKLVYLQEQLYPSDGRSGLPVGNKRSQVVRQKLKTLKWFDLQFKEIHHLFQQQLKV
jgi:hypothetical protein